MAKAVLMRPQVAALSTYRTHFISSPAVQRLRGTAMTYYQPVLQRIFSPEKLLAGLPLQPRTVASKTKWKNGLVTSRRSFCTRAMNQVNDPGSISSSLMQSMEKKIKEHVSAESVSVTDINGDGRHVSIDVISSNFEGKSAVNRQRMVYKAIWEELQNTVHAVDQMTTRTPSEAAGN